MQSDLIWYPVLLAVVQVGLYNFPVDVYSLE